MSKHTVKVKGRLSVPVPAHIPLPIDTVLSRWRAGEFETLWGLKIAIEDYAIDKAERRINVEEHRSDAEGEIRIEHSDDTDVDSIINELEDRLGLGEADGGMAPHGGMNPNYKGD